MVAMDQAAAAAAVSADQKLPREREARVKAAAWAWYHRSGGSIVPGSAGKSEAFASRCTARLTPSRFQREAAVMRSRILASHQGSDASTLTRSSSSMGKLSGSSSSLSSSMATPVCASDQADDPTCLDIFWNSDQDSADQPSIAQPSLELISMDPAACWDCGSSLFDSFELIAMSKKLDAELDEPNFDGQLEDVHPVCTDSQYKEQNVLSLCDAPQDAVPPPQAPHHETNNTLDIFDKLISASDKQSKRAVYDMFCHYGDAAKHVTKQSCKRSQPADATFGGASRKHKLRPGRLSFHGFAKALHSFTHLQLHASSGGGDQSDGSEGAVQDHHHHHHLHYSPYPQASMTGKAMHAQSQGVTTPSVDHHAYDDVVDGTQSKARHVHHHHHHHYHYLFHSDDDFAIQPLDKSLVVAAAGLRASKVSPALSSYLESPARGEFPLDFGRKLAEFGSIPSPNFQY